MTTFGKPLWTIWPIDYKVRVRKEKESGLVKIPKGGSSGFWWESPLGDIAGYNALTDALTELGFIEYKSGEGFTELQDFEIEALNPNWRTDLLDFYREFWSNAWTCEKGKLPEPLEPFYNNREETGTVCQRHDLGAPIPVALNDFTATSSWIEAHLKRDKPKKDRRGTNPNSLKNLKHFKVESGGKEGEE